jgi:hypothetical protein|tara:strand:+ start:796 stop:933 length:138 start_codon:yes stop_codon:yes gene_type:complete
MLALLAVLTLMVEINFTYPTQDFRFGLFSSTGNLVKVRLAVFLLG